MAAITSSFDSNFCPASDFFKLGTKRSRTGPNLENTVDGTAVRSLIWPIWPWRRRRCEPVRCHGGSIKSADATTSTRGQNKTMSPIRLIF